MLLEARLPDKLSTYLLERVAGDAPFTASFLTVAILEVPTRGPLVTFLLDLLAANTLSALLSIKTLLFTKTLFLHPFLHPKPLNLLKKGGQ